MTFNITVNTLIVLPHLLLNCFSWGIVVELYSWRLKHFCCPHCYITPCNFNKLPPINLSNSVLKFKNNLVFHLYLLTYELDCQYFHTFLPAMLPILTSLLLFSDAVQILCFEPWGILTVFVRSSYRSMLREETFQSLSRTKSFVTPMLQFTHQIVNTA